MTVSPLLFFHQISAGVPGLSDFFTNSVVAIAHLIESESVQFACIDLSFLIEYFLVSQHPYDLAQNTKPVRLILEFDHFAFQRQGIFFNDRCVYLIALYSVQARPYKLICHLVGGRDAQKIGFPQSVRSGNGQRECVPLPEIRYSFVISLQVQRHHLCIADAAPGHHHNVDGIILIVGADHICRHGKQVWLHTEFFLHFHSILSSMPRQIIDSSVRDRYNYSRCDKQKQVRTSRIDTIQKESVMPKECITDCRLEETGFNYTMSLIQGKYKMLILYTLARFDVVRFNEMQKYIGTITFKTLSSTLKQLEAAGLIHRKEYPQIPPKVEYSLTEDGKSLIPILSQMCDWGEAHRSSK
nr:MAG TPA: putative transcriptional regulator [Bacteriophage sp.]